MEKENLDAEEQDLLRKLEEIRKKKEELAKPLEAITNNVFFSGLGGFIEVKLSRFDSDILNRLRLIPSRRYIEARQVNVFHLDNYDRLVYELNEVDLKLQTSEEYEKKITEWKIAPDFFIIYDEPKHQIKVQKSIKQKPHPYLYELTTWTDHPSYGYYTFSLNELLKFSELILKNGMVYESSDQIKSLLEEQARRESLLNEFADMKDAPDIDFTFKWTDSNGVEINYSLKPDQRVACKFDDTFSNRTLLSYDMGKGKTAIAIAQAERHSERVLFICKADLKTNIKREIRKFTGKEALIFSGIEPDGLAIDLMIKEDRKQKYNILNYDVIGRAVKDAENPDDEGFMKWVALINLSKFDRIIYDEAHYMKNMESQRSRGGRALKATKVMLLTGTPIVNRPGEIFPILNIIDPVTFYDYSAFKNQFVDAEGNPKNLSTLHKLLKRYMIRRLRDSNLDPTRIPQYTELSSRARTHYNQVLAGLYTALRNPDYQRNVTSILTELLRLKQICADDKVDFTVDLAETALDETSMMPWNKVIIFSQFKATQAEIASRLGSKAAIINGDVTDKARYELIDKFQDASSSLKVLVTNIVEGITLTAAGTVIINDLWWTPKDHSQQEGRAFGRENDPHGGNAYYVLCEDSLDDMIWMLLERKRNIAKQIVDDVYNSAEAEKGMISELLGMLRGRL